tara:strand:- start:7096 stop:7374 length:279 start_codon:yes stop_codon:yes gene_type:complete
VVVEMRRDIDFRETSVRAIGCLLPFRIDDELRARVARGTTTGAAKLAVAMTMWTSRRGRDVRTTMACREHGRGVLREKRVTHSRNIPKSENC